MLMHPSRSSPPPAHAPLGETHCSLPQKLLFHAAITSFPVGIPNPGQLPNSNKQPYLAGSSILHTQEPLCMYGFKPRVRGLPFISCTVNCQLYHSLFDLYVFNMAIIMWFSPMTRGKKWPPHIKYTLLLRANIAYTKVLSPSGHLQDIKGHPRAYLSA